jgi:hypothetical protein
MEGHENGIRTEVSRLVVQCFPKPSSKSIHLMDICPYGVGVLGLGKTRRTNKDWQVPLLSLTDALFLL